MWEKMTVVRTVAIVLFIELAYRSTILLRRLNY